VTLPFLPEGPEDPDGIVRLADALARAADIAA
jgi:hypothetical protein